MINTNFIPFPSLTTERLLLRPLEATDDQDIFAHRSDDAVNTYLEDFRHASIRDTQVFIHRVQNEIVLGKTILWVLSHKGNNRFMGTVCLWNISEEDARAEAGYTLAPGFQGMGYMHEALVKAISFGFHTIGLRTIEAYTHQHNQSSIRLLLRNNFKPGIPQKQVGSDRVYFSLTTAAG